MQSRVSVVIPCHGQAHFLADAIESVLRQTVPVLELVVVNDGSPDTALMERVLAPFMDRIIYIRQENAGVAIARNAGLDRCQAEYLIFLDSDDRLLPNAVADGAAALTARPERGLVWGLRHLVDAAGRRSRLDVGWIGAGEQYVDLLRTNIVGPPVGVMWRRSAVIDIGGFSLVAAPAEDYDAYLRIAQRHEIHRHGETVAEYRLHGANMSCNDARMFAGVEETLARQVEWVGKDADLRSALEAGRRDAQHQYDWLPRLNAVRELYHERQWRRAGAAAVALFGRYPGLLLAEVNQNALRFVWRRIFGRRHSGASQLPINSGIGIPSTSGMSLPSNAASVGARSRVDTTRPS